MMDAFVVFKEILFFSYLSEEKKEMGVIQSYFEEGDIIQKVGIVFGILLASALVIVLAVVVFRRFIGRIRLGEGTTKRFDDLEPGWKTAIGTFAASSRIGDIEKATESYAKRMEEAADVNIFDPFTPSHPAYIKRVENIAFPVEDWWEKGFATMFPAENTELTEEEARGIYHDKILFGTDIDIDDENIPSDKDFVSDVLKRSF